MGGNVLMGFHEKNPESPEEISEAEWSVVLPKVAVGLAPIPGGRGRRPRWRRSLAWRRTPLHKGRVS